MTKEEVFNFIRQRLSFSKELQEQFSMWIKTISQKNIADLKCPKWIKDIPMHDFQHSDSERVCRSWHLWLYFLSFSTSTMALQPFISNTSPKMKIWNIHLPDIPQRKSSLQFLNWLSSPESPKEIAAKKNCTERQCEVKRLLWLSFLAPSFYHHIIFATRIAYLPSLYHTLYSHTIFPAFISSFPSYSEKNISLSHAFCPSAWWNRQKRFLFLNGVNNVLSLKLEN